MSRIVERIPQVLNFARAFRCRSYVVISLRAFCVEWLPVLYFQELKKAFHEVGSRGLAHLER